jgi:hypothetical protein
VLATSKFLITAIKKAQETTKQDQKVEAGRLVPLAQPRTFLKISRVSSGPKLSVLQEEVMPEEKASKAHSLTNIFKELVILRVLLYKISQLVNFSGSLKLEPLLILVTTLYIPKKVQNSSE